MIFESVNTAIKYRLSSVEQAVTTLINKLGSKISEMNIDEQALSAITSAVGNVNEKDFADKLVDAFIDKGVIEAKKPRKKASTK